MRLASEAARRPGPEEAAPVAASPAVPAIAIDDPRRPPLAPRPAINQNARTPRAVPVEEHEPARFSALRVVAWIVLAPWYAAVALAAIGVDVLFVKDLFGL